MRSAWCIAVGLAGALVLPSATLAGDVLEAKAPAKDVRLVHAVVAGAEADGAILPVHIADTAGNLWDIRISDGALNFVAIPKVVVRPTPRPENILPDGEVTYGRNDIASAWLINPTDRYDHGILGDAIEAAGLVLKRRDGTLFRYLLDPGSVFEDRRVRLIDLDNDGADEAIVVQSYLDEGAALSVFALGADGVDYISEVPAIGRPNRWLNPVGAADFDGDGFTEVAFVETPHIGGTLKLYEFRDGKLRFDAAASGFSNHAIGSRELDQNAIYDWNRDGVLDIALPDARRRSLRVVTFAGGEFRQLA